MVITLHWFVGESVSNGPLIAVSVIAGVLLIAAVIQLIMLIKQRADTERWYLLFCTEYHVFMLLYNEVVLSFFDF